LPILASGDWPTRQSWPKVERRFSSIHDGARLGTAMIGRTFLHRFRVDRLLCEGGMGRIYLARQTTDGREVVVKVLKEQFAATPADRERFRREVQVLSRFQHPYVVEFHGGSVDDPSCMFLIMEYVRGRELDLILRERRRFTPERVGRILAPLCDVLQAAHDRGFVHCDVKPANIMVMHPDTPLEGIKLMDFGLAKTPMTLSLTALEMRNTGEVVSGSPGYMSPEQAAGEDLDHRSDVYSVGVTLYELLTGQLPFERPTVAGLLAAQRNDVAPSFAQRSPGASVPQPIEMLVHRCLAKHRELRPQSAAELFKLYEKALGRPIVVPHKPAARSTAAAPAPLPALSEPTPPPAPKEMIDPNAAVYKLDIVMPESMAMLKLRGFVHDLGGQLDGGEAGLIRFRVDSARFDKVPEAAPATSSTGLRSWFGGSNAVKPAHLASVVIVVELRIERADPKQPNHLTLTANLRARNNLSLSRRDLRDRYDKIHRELKAYLQTGR
jgi:eukaryotic-like serine/threonine-protein kinase